MRDTIKAKAARWSVANEKDCGKCENCLEVAEAKDAYERSMSVCGPDIRNALRHNWLEASRLKRCQYWEMQKIVQQAGRASRGPKGE